MLVVVNSINFILASNGERMFSDEDDIFIIGKEINYVGAIEAIYNQFKCRYYYYIKIVVNGSEQNICLDDRERLLKQKDLLKKTMIDCHGEARNEL